MLTVNVTQKHIDTANPKECLHSCIVAMALRDMFPAEEIEVGLTIATVNGISYNLPEETTQNIKKWCFGIHFEPFTFEMEEQQYGLSP